MTYRDLESILNRFGFYFENPKNNFIDIVRYEKKRRIPLVGKIEDVRVRVGNIAYPGAGRTADHSAIKKVREMCGLDDRNKVDGGAFFQGLDPVKELIGRYREPLIRLGDR